MIQISRGVAKVGAFVFVVATLGLASPLAPAAQASATVPGVPRAVNAVAASDTSITVTWTAPASDGGSPVTDYLIQYRDTGIGGWPTRFPTGPWSDFTHASTSTTATISGLTTMHKYEFRVAAVNVIGAGVWNNQALATDGAGYANSCTVFRDQSTYCRSDTTQPFDGTTSAKRVVGMAIRSNGACLLFGDGKIKCRGSSNSYGQLGDGTTNVPSGSSWADVVGIDGSTPAKTGRNHVGQLGGGGTTDSSVPVAIPTLTGSTAATTAVDVSAANGGTCVILQDGSVTCWGTVSTATFGQVAYFDGSTDAKKAVTFGGRGLEGIRTNAAGNSLGYCVLTASAQVACWMGQGTVWLVGPRSYPRDVPAPVSGVTGVTALAQSQTAVCVLLTTGSVSCWGEGDNGQLGDGLGVTASGVVQVVGLDGSDEESTATSIFATSINSFCATRAVGDTVCWGMILTASKSTPSVFDGNPTATAQYSGGGGGGGAPDTPLVPVAVAGDGRATVTVTLNTSGVAPTRYTIFEWADSSKSCTFLASSSAPSCTVTGLTNGTAYRFVVIASAGSAFSTRSQPSNIVVPVGVSTATTPNPPTGASGDGQATLTVVPGSGGTTPVSYRVFVVGNPSNFCLVSNPALSMSCVITGLTNGTTYTFRAAAFDGVLFSGPSSPSAPVTPSAVADSPPGKPRSLVIATRTAGTLGVTWAAPASPGSSAITGYTVAWREVGSAWVAGNTKSAPVLNATVTGLTAGKSYEIRVSATNATLTGAWSASTTGIVPVKAAAPQNVKGVASGLKITLTWSKVTTPSHSPVLKYSMYCAVGLENPARAQVGPTITTATLTVTQRKLYVCRVAAVTAAGRGTDSAPIRVTVK